MSDNTDNEDQIKDFLSDLPARLPKEKSYLIYTNLPDKYKDTIQFDFIPYQTTDSSQKNYLSSIPNPTNEMSYYMIHYINPTLSLNKAITEINNIYNKWITFEALKIIYFIYKSDPIFQYNLPYVVRMLDVNIYSTTPSTSIYICTCVSMEHKIPVPDEYSTFLLFTPLSIPSISTISIIEHSIKQLKSKLSWTWSNTISKYSTEIMTKVNDPSIFQNILFYEAVLKFALYENGVLSENMDEPFDQMLSIVEENFIQYLQLYPDITRKLPLVATQEYYFPNIYSFDKKLLNAILTTIPTTIDQTTSDKLSSFLQTDYFIKSNRLGKALTNALRSIKTVSLTINDFIRNYMKDTSKKCLSFISNHSDISTIRSTIKAILEIDYTTTSILSIDELSQLKSVFSPEELRVFGSDILSTETLDSWISVLYQYAIYVYDTIYQKIELTTTVHEITEKEINDFFHGEKEKLLQKPLLSSTMFPSVNQLIGCVVESFMEYSILFIDLQGDLFLKRPSILDNTVQKVKTDITFETIDSFIKRLSSSLTSFSSIDLDIVLPKDQVGINWLTANLLWTCYRENDIPISISECDTFILPILKKLIYILQSDDHAQKQYLYKWINRFTGRNNILGLPQYQISLPISYDYPIDVLLAEQKRMRRFPTITEPFYVTHITLLEQELQRHSIEEKELRKQLDLFTPNHPEYKSKKERLNTIVKNQFHILNRINIIHLHSSGEERISDPLPTWKRDDLTSLLTEKELNLSPKEQMVMLYQLYKQKQELLTDREIEIIQVRIVDYILDTTNTIRSQLSDHSIYNWNDKDVMILLQSMYCYDIEHMFLFYSILYLVLTTLSPQFIILDKKQTAFLLSCKEHINWLIEIGIYPSVTKINIVISKLLHEGKPICHVISDDNNYSPYSNTEHVLHLVSQHEQRFNEQASFPREWFPNGIISIPTLYSLLKRYNHYMNKTPMTMFGKTQEITLFCSEINAILQKIQNESLQSYLREMYYDIEQMKWFTSNDIKEKEKFPRFVIIKRIHHMISYYVYGNGYKLSELLHHYYMTNQTITNEVLPEVIIHHIIDNYSSYSNEDENKYIIRLLHNIIQK
jgi:hypothetical protein